MKNTENIFKIISRDDPCYNLNNTLLPNFYPHQCFYQMSENKYLIKYFSNYDLYKWELYVYNRLLDYDLTPKFIDYGKSVYTNMCAIAIDISNMITLRRTLSLLKEKDKKTLINEVFSFINSLKDYGIFHNNINIDNIYIKDNQFYIIEFTNMKIKKQINQDCYDTKDQNSYDHHIDIFSLYSSISSDNKNDEILKYIRASVLNKYNLDSYDFVHKITDYYI
jgi:hypothetical protein